MTANRYGLSRPIPPDVRRQVRRNSKQGCVLCRQLVCDYHHFAPAFVDAREHDPDGICLLCTAHHGEVTRGRLLNPQVAAAYERIRNDDTVRPPYHQALITGTLKLELGDATFDYMPNGACVLRYDDEEVITVIYRSDEVFGGAYPSISGTIRNANAEPVLVLEDNTIVLSTYELDATMVGPRLTLRDRRSAIVLELTLLPPNGLRIDRLTMRHREIELNFDRTFGVTVPARKSRHFIAVPSVETKGAASAVRYDTAQKDALRNVEFHGGVGLLFPFGITLAERAGVMLIKRATMRTA
jgi:hypothetical protein